ncbi:MAG: hypothetical protein LRY73_04200 [Bacillus sp. (in: Bacteria)]|nr:hypothetical protein [Bacillus sp. (in: firmicutes)]
MKGKSSIEVIYETGMFILAFAAVATIWYQTRYDIWIVWGTWGIFFVDFLYRFFTTKKKWQFIRSNPFIVIAIIPLDAIFQLARVARLLHFMRLKVITQYYTKPLINTIYRQKFLFVFPIGMMFVFISVIPLYILEPKLTTYYDAFLGGLASLVFFGYSVIHPQTTLGTIIITLLTITGVVIHGVILRTILTYLFQLPLIRQILRSKDKKIIQCKKTDEKVN